MHVASEGCQPVEAEGGRALHQVHEGRCVTQQLFGQVEDACLGLPFKISFHLRSLKAAGKAKAAPAKGKSAAKPKPKPKSGDGKSSVPAASETGEGPKRKRRKTN